MQAFWVYYYPVAMQFDARPPLYPELIKQLYLDKEVNVFTNQGVLIKGKITMFGIQPMLQWGDLTDMYL